jgi:hypothetical protein
LKKEELVKLFMAFYYQLLFVEYCSADKARGVPIKARKQSNQSKKIYSRIKEINQTNKGFLEQATKTHPSPEGSLSAFGQEVMKAYQGVSFLTHHIRRSAFEF